MAQKIGGGQGGDEDVGERRRSPLGASPRRRNTGARKSTRPEEHTEKETPTERAQRPTHPVRSRRSARSTPTPTSPVPPRPGPTLLADGSGGRLPLRMPRRAGADGAGKVRRGVPLAPWGDVHPPFCPHTPPSHSVEMGGGGGRLPSARGQEGKARGPYVRELNGTGLTVSAAAQESILHKMALESCSPLSGAPNRPFPPPRLRRATIAHPAWTGPGPQPGERRGESSTGTPKVGRLTIQLGECQTATTGYFPPVAPRARASGAAYMGRCAELKTGQKARRNGLERQKRRSPWAPRAVEGRASDWSGCLCGPTAPAVRRENKIEAPAGR